MKEQNALKYDLQVAEGGHVELNLPFPAGTHVIVFVIQSGESMEDMVEASESSLDFWLNSYDDEDWNNA